MYGAWYYLLRPFDVISFPAFCVKLAQTADKGLGLKQDGRLSGVGGEGGAFPPAAVGGCLVGIALNACIQRLS